MKTDAIRSALGSLGFTHDVSEAMAELNALEESHAEMVRALRAFVKAAPAIEVSNFGGEELLDAAREALRKAGAL